jgi:hypothetical protein
LPALLDVIDAGATRCGATATAVILDDFIAQQAGKNSNLNTIAAPKTD